VSTHLLILRSTPQSINAPRQNVYEQLDKLKILEIFMNNNQWPDGFDPMAAGALLHQVEQDTVDDD
jgi:hypothetical protein